MFGSIALDVVTGMVLIYLLYSLLATILGEMISSWLGIRAKLLRRAIERMLNDGYDIDKDKLGFKKLRKQVGDFFLHEYKDFENSLAGRFYNYPSIKYISEGSKKFLSPFGSGKPSYITKKTFSQTMIHLLRTKGGGISDIDKIDFCLKFNTLHIQPQTLSYFRNLFTDAGGDINAFDNALQKWFEDTMDRTTGWYKRKLRLILFIMGFIIAVSFNVDSISVASKLTKDKVAREQLVQLSVAASDTGSSIYHALKQTQDTTITDSLARTGFRNVMQSVNDANQILGTGWERKRLGEILRVALSFWKLPFWGFILTALALSLGAPFWFDLLQKLVALRSAGIKPEEKDTAASVKHNPTGPSPVTPPLNASPSPTASVPHPAQLDTIAQFRSSIYKENGVVAINSGWDATSPRRSIEVHVKNIMIKNRLAKIFGTRLKMSTGEVIGISYSVMQDAVNVVHMAAMTLGEGVGNKTQKNGFGTLGCYLGREADNNSYLLSCWHVLKDDTQWNSAPVERNIIDTTGTIIATISDGCLHEKIDIGLAACSSTDKVSNQVLGIKRQQRSVTPSDAFYKTNVCIDGRVCKYRKAIIYYDETDAPIQYPDGNTYLMKDLFSITVIDPQTNARRAPTSEGDSGAVVVDFSTGEPLGMVIGGNNEFSYAMKFTNVFDDDAIYSNYYFLLSY